MGYNYNLVCLLSALITHEGLLGTAEVLASNGGWIDVPEPVGRMVLYFHVRFQKYGFMGLEIHLYRYTYHMYIFICLRIRNLFFFMVRPNFPAHTLLHVYITLLWFMYIHVYMFLYKYMIYFYPFLYVFPFFIFYFYIRL